MSQKARWGNLAILSMVLVALVSLAVLAGCGDSTTTTTAGTTATTAGTDTTDTTMAPPEQDKIVIGAARPLSGGLSVFEGNNFGPSYKLWVEDVNAAGGINVAGKMLPIELKIYDDQSDLDTSMRLLSKLMEEDKVDFVLAPASTAFLFAAAGVANANKYIMMSAEGGATSLEKELQKGTLPYFFQGLNYSNHDQMPAWADILKEAGAKTAAVVYLDDLHGIEYQAQAAVFLSAAGIEIVQSTPIPGDIKDMTSILKQIQDKDPDAVAFFAYPGQNILAMQTMMQLDYSPRAVLIGPGGASQWFANMFGDAIDGVMFEGAWSANSSPEAKAYEESLTQFMGSSDNVDHWGALIYRSQLEFFQQAIEKAGTLDQDVIAEVMRTSHFPTSMSSDTFYTNQIFDRTSYAGQIGQWQGGVAEVIDVGDKRTAAPIYPKPAWPAAQ